MRAVAVLAVVAGAAVLSSCGSPGTAGRTVVITEATTGPTSAALGDTVVVELVSSSYGRDGRLVAWGRPVSDTPAVLAREGSEYGPCPRAATCTTFSPRALGTATVSAVGPSGILCPGPGRSPCVGVTAAVRRFEVRVVARS